MAESAKEPSRPPAAHEPEAAATPQSDGSHAVTCPVAWCPICLSVAAVQPLRPDVVEHLLRAGTEMLLAFRAVIDTRANELDPNRDEPDEGPTRLEKIDLG